MTFFSRGPKWQTYLLVLACMVLLSATWFFHTRKPYQSEVAAAQAKEEAARGRVASQTETWKQYIQRQIDEEQQANFMRGLVGPEGHEEKSFEDMRAELEQAQNELKDASIARSEIQKQQVAAQIEQDRRRDYTRIGLTFLIFPFAAYVLILKKSSPASRTAAASAIAALLAFWFAK